MDEYTTKFCVTKPDDGSGLKLVPLWLAGLGTSIPAQDRYCDLDSRTERITPAFPRAFRGVVLCTDGGSHD